MKAHYQLHSKKRIAIPCLMRQAPGLSPCCISLNFLALIETLRWGLYVFLASWEVFSYFRIILHFPSTASTWEHQDHAKRYIPQFRVAPISSQELAVSALGSFHLRESTAESLLHNCSSETPFSLRSLEIFNHFIFMTVNEYEVKFM